eukprot:1400900-Amphidinium_carterae.2
MGFGNKRMKAHEVGQAALSRAIAGARVVPLFSVKGLLWFAPFHTVCKLLCRTLPPTTKKQVGDI